MTNTCSKLMSAVLAATLLLPALPASAEVPPEMSIQGFLKDVSGSPADGTYVLRLALYTQRESGLAFWEDSREYAVVDGVFDASPGGDLLNPLFADDFQSNAQVWLGITVVDGLGVGNEPELPRTRIRTAASAFMADYADTAVRSGFAMTAASATLAQSAMTATTADTATSAGVAATADTAATAQHALSAGTAQTADEAGTAAHADSASQAVRAGMVGSVDEADHADFATTTERADSATTANTATHANSAATAALAGTADHAASVQLANSATTATNALSAQTATTALQVGFATSANHATVATSAQTAGSVQTAETAGSATSANSATTATMATNAQSAATATTATSASSAGSATTATVASALDCTNCVALTHMAFDPVTQAELNAAFAGLSSLSSVDGLIGGTITGDISVTGTLSAATFSQNGRNACDKSGNCGATLARLTCEAGETAPRFVGGQWVCAEDVVSEADRATTATTATNLACVGCVAESELAFDPATQAELAAAIASVGIPAALDGLDGGTITSTTTVQGAVAAATIRQSNRVVCTAAGNCGQQLSSLVCAPGSTKAKWDVLQSAWVCVQDRAASAANANTATTATVASNLICDGCVAPSEMAFDPATQAELQAKVDQVTQAIADVDLPTTVDGLGGGTLTSGLSVSGTLTAETLDGTDVLEAAIILQGGNAVCDASGNCGTPLGDQPACPDGQTVVRTAAGDAWECTALSGSAEADPGQPCPGLDEVKNWDGAQWVCVSANAGIGTTSSANGFRYIDPWGLAWDGVARSPKFWQLANADCASDGGRLPLYTELWRNRYNPGHVDGADSALTSSRDDWYHWSLTPHYSADYYLTFRPHDHSRTNHHGPSTRQEYRCVWPDQQRPAFDGNDCYGPPGDECHPSRGIWNVDKYDRPPIPLISANFECHFHNASLLDLEDVHNLTREGWENPNSGRWRWMNNIDSGGGGNRYYHLYKWYHEPEPWWGWDNSTHGWGDEGGVTPHSDWQYFRCIGKQDASYGTPHPNPPCQNGNCYTVSTRKSRLVADNEDRQPLEYRHAAETCRLIGGSLPTGGEATELMQLGWDNGNRNWHWTNKATYSGSYGYLLYRWGTNFPTKADVRWAWDGDRGSWTTADAEYPFRCVWHDTQEADFTTCEIDKVQKWVAATRSWECVDRVDGDADGRANGNASFKDAWGSDWDQIERGQTTWEAARDDCVDDGARLPTPTELWRVRYQQGIVTTEDLQGNTIPWELGTTGTTNYLWTMAPSYHGDHRIIRRLNDGVEASTSHDSQTDGSVRPYRCIWPATKGDALGGKGCYGKPEDGCFEIPGNRMRVDYYNRGHLPVPAAAWECRFEGGRVPGPELYAKMVHAGAPNGSGSDNWTIMMSAVHDIASGYGSVQANWVGTGNPNWHYISGTSSWIWEITYRQFRCVFTDTLD